MKVIFLDVDGVLNCRYSETRCGCFLGIDDDKLQRLRRIVEATGARLVLTSTWKECWDREHKEDQDLLANYLDRTLKAAGLRILEKTEDTSYDRGAGILRWVSAHPVETFVILDDEAFDYAELELIDRWVETVYGSPEGGLQERHVRRAVDILNKQRGE